MSDTSESETIAIVEERPVVGKRETHKRVHVRTATVEREQWVEQELRHENVSIERIPVERYVTSIPEARHEGDRLIIPLVEEVLVIEKRLFVREELHVIKVVSHDHVREQVALRGTDVIVERPDEDA